METRNLITLQPQTTHQKRLESDCYVEGYATTFEPYELYEYDGIKYYEQIDRNAFNNADMSDVIMQYDHTGRVYARQTNKTLFLEVDEHGLFIYADLSKTSASRSLFEDIDSGLITKMSWAFTVTESSYDSETRTRKILKVGKVYDVSAVSIPANNDTEINARDFKSFEDEKRKQKLKLKIKLGE